MVKAGVNVARLNFSHGDHESHKKYIDTVRKVSKKLDQPLAVLQDLSGPKIRTGDFENMAPTEVNGTVVDDNAVTVTLAADNVNAIRWMADDEKGSD